MSKLTNKDRFIGDENSAIKCSYLGELPINKYFIHDVTLLGWEFIKSKDGNYYSTSEVRDYINKLRDCIKAKGGST